jgi:hypothetical protein
MSDFENPFRQSSGELYDRVLVWGGRAVIALGVIGGINGGRDWFALLPIVGVIWIVQGVVAILRGDVVDPHRDNPFKPHLVVDQETDREYDRRDPARHLVWGLIVMLVGIVLLTTRDSFEP